MMLPIENADYKIDEIIDDLGPMLSASDIEIFLLQGMSEAKSLVSYFALSEIENISIDAVCSIFSPSVINKNGIEVARTKKNSDSMGEFRVWSVDAKAYVESDALFSLIVVGVNGSSLISNSNRELDVPFVFGQKAFCELLFLIFYYKFNSKYFETILAMPNWREFVNKAFTTLDIDMERSYYLSKLVVNHYRNDLSLWI